MRLISPLDVVKTNDMKKHDQPHGRADVDKAPETKGPPPSSANRLAFTMPDRDQLKDLLERIAELRGTFPFQTFADLVQEIADSPSLQKKLITFYDNHGDTPLVGTIGRLYISVPEKTILLTQYLAFKVTGGNASAFFRAVVRYYAEKYKLGTACSAVSQAKPLPKGVVVERSMTATPTLSSLADRRNARLLGEGHVSTSFTIDDRTNQYINSIVPVMEMKRIALLRSMIEQSVAQDEIEKIKAFYLEEWDGPHPQGRMKLCRFNCSKKLDSLLDYLSYMVIGKVKRSEMLRVLVAYFYHKRIA